MPNRLCWYRPCCTIPDVHLRCLFSAEDTHSPGLNLVPDFTKTTAYVLCAIVFQETSVRHSESENSVCPPSPILLSFFRRLTTPVAHPPSSSSRNSTRVTLHLASVSRIVGSYSRRFERTRNDTVSPLSLPFFSSILSRPPSFYSIPLQERKRMIEMPRVDRPSSLMALLFFDLRVKKICMRILLELITSDSFFGYLPLLNNKLQMKDKRDILS